MQTSRTPFRPSQRHLSLPGFLLAVASSLLAVPGAAIAQFDQVGNMPNQADTSAVLDQGAASTPQNGPGTLQLRQPLPYTATPARPLSQTKPDDQNDLRITNHLSYFAHALMLDGVQGAHPTHAGRRGSQQRLLPDGT